MTPEPIGGAALRPAALMLHAMAPVDQAWLLASLSPQRRDRLRALLEELRSLGIPADAALLDQADKADASLPVPSATERLEDLDSAEVAWLAARLQDEPPELAVLLLAHRAWPWRAALLDLVDTTRRQWVTTAEGRPDRLLPQKALVEALARMLPARTAAPRLSLAGRVRTWLQRWRIRGVPA